MAVGAKTQKNERGLYLRRESLSLFMSFRLFSTRLIREIYRQTRDPIWLNVQKAQKSQEWRPILSSHDISSALSALATTGHSIQTVPPWLILYLTAYKVHTAQHANGPLLHLVFTYLSLPTSPPPTHGPLLILAALSLSRLNLLLPLRQIIDAFLTSPHVNEQSLFNLLLQALSHTPARSIESANSIVAILRSMDARNLKLNSLTYDALLNDRFITLQLSKFLHVRMVHEGLVPTTDQLESFLRIFAKNGAIHDAKTYLDLIHSTSHSQSHHANSTFLSAQDKKTNALAFLQSLAPQNSSIYESTSALHVASKDLSTSTYHLIRSFLSIPSPTTPTYTVLIQGLLLRNQFKKAEIFFHKLRKSGLVIDNPALTVGVEALTRNGNPHAAFQLFEKYALKPAHHPHKTPSPSKHPSQPLTQPPIQLTTISLNQFLVSLNRISRPDISLRLFTHMSTLYGPTCQPTSQSLNILLQSARLGSKLDDTILGALYSNFPNTNFHTVVGGLKKKLDNLRMSIGLKALPPFKHHHSSHTRKNAVNSILTALGHPSRGGLRRYVNSTWQNKPAVQFAQDIFLQVIFGVDMQASDLPGSSPPSSSEKVALKDITSPAAAYRTGPTDTSTHESPFFPTLPKPKLYTYTPPLPSSPPTPLSPYPSLIPTNSNFFNYIALLGTSSLSHQIPLALAHMRALHIQPSTSTLALALVFWAEVAIPPPLLLLHKHHRQQQREATLENAEEYVKLVDWLREWVGERRLPHWRTLGKWREIVRKMRLEDVFDELEEQQKGDEVEGDAGP